MKGCSWESQMQRGNKNKGNQRLKFYGCLELVWQQTKQKKFLLLLSWHISTSQKHCAVRFSSEASSHGSPSLRESPDVKHNFPTAVCRKTGWWLASCIRDIPSPDEEAPRNPLVNNSKKNDVVYVRSPQV